KEKQQVFVEYEILEEFLLQQVTQFKTIIFNNLRNRIIEICDDISSPDPIKRINKSLKTKGTQYDEKLGTFPEEWQNTAKVLHNALLLDCRILSEQKIIQEIIGNFTDKINLTLSENIISPIDNILNNIGNAKNPQNSGIKNIT